jgi:hypothetical protein
MYWLKEQSHENWEAAMYAASLAPQVMQIAKKILFYTVTASLLVMFF